MATPRYWFHIATIVFGGEEKLFALGGALGSIGSPNMLNTVEQWVEESSTWKAADNLVEERSGFNVMTAPKNLVCE